MIGWAFKFGLALVVVVVVAHLMGGTEALLGFLLDQAERGVDVAREQAEGLREAEGR